MTPITSAIGLQMSAKLENTTWKFQNACQYYMSNKSAGGWGMRDVSKLPEDPFTLKILLPDGS